MSTLIGQSVLTDELCYMIIGDLAFYYDMNSLGIRHIKNNLRIIIINNNGGVEFKLNDRDHVITDKYIAAANHYKCAKGWAEDCGFNYVAVRSKDELLQKKDILIKKSDHPIVMEIFVTDSDDYIGYKTIVEANKEETMGEKMKKMKKELSKLIRH